jgi:hypothetical protein
MTPSSAFCDSLHFRLALGIGEPKASFPVNSSFKPVVHFPFRDSTADRDAHGRIYTINEIWVSACFILDCARFPIRDNKC